MSRGRLVVYVTSHGFGHLNRAVAVINRVPKSVPVTIRCHANLFKHWGERLTRPAELGEHQSDSGVVNPPGDSAATDGPASLEAAARTYAEAEPRIDAEARVLRELGASVVLCDLPYLPFVAARRANVSAFGLGNFTWSEIYAPHARKAGGEAPALVAAIRRAYRQASGLFRCQPSLRMREFPNIVDVGMVVTPGRDRKAELKRELGLSKSDKIIYAYLGRYGQEGLGWGRLEGWATRGWHFVGFHPAPATVASPPNLHVVDPVRWTGADLAATADAMLAKAGYGTACEAMASGTPMLYPPRTGFGEYRALDRALRAWGGGVPVPARDFHDLRLERAIERALQLTPGPPPLPADGAVTIARHLTELCRKPGLSPIASRSSSKA